MDNIVDKIKLSDFKELLERVNKYKSIGIDYLYNEFKTGNNNLKSIQRHWEETLDDGKPDFSVYNLDDYINEAFYCWKTYSRRYLLLITKYLAREDCQLNCDDVDTIVDLGCGIAYTTIGLKQIFKNSTVYGTNIADTIQYKIDRDITNDLNGCYIIDESEMLKLDKIDLVFASEFFEHLVEPLDLLIELITKHKPKYFIFANTFTQMAIGHFRQYKYNNNYYDGKTISRMFGKILRESGYIKLDTHFFNNRPNIYKLSTTQTNKLFEV